MATSGGWPASRTRRFTGHQRQPRTFARDPPRVIAAMRELAYPQPVRSRAPRPAEELGVVSFDTTLYGPASSCSGSSGPRTRRVLHRRREPQGADRHRSSSDQLLRSRAPTGPRDRADQRGGRGAPQLPDIPLVVRRAPPTSSRWSRSTSPRRVRRAAPARPRPRDRVAHRRPVRAGLSQSNGSMAGARPRGRRRRGSGAAVADWSARSYDSAGAWARIRRPAVFLAKDQKALVVLRAMHEAGPRGSRAMSASSAPTTSRGAVPHAAADAVRRPSSSRHRAAAGAADDQADRGSPRLAGATGLSARSTRSGRPRG